MSCPPDSKSFLRSKEMQQRAWSTLCSVVLVGCCCSSMSTANPSASQVDRCRRDMCLGDVHIMPQGYKFSPGMDAIMWFKFVAKTSQITDVFDPQQIDTSTFRDGFRFHNSPMTEWWDADERKLTGGQAETSEGCFIDVGFENNDDGTLTVYIMWFQT